jgi:predicted metal-binding membrane protein
LPERHRQLNQTADTPLETVLRRDRVVVLAALAIITILAWTYVVWLAIDMDMGGMDMTGFRMVPAGIGLMMVSTAPWDAVEFGFVFLMWAVMMIGMMTPSAAPMILIYARVGRQATAQGKPFAATGWFAGGYLAAWLAFSLAATAAEWALDRAALLSPTTMQSTSNLFGGIVLIAAGFYQWLPLKEACLKHCQAPLLFIQQHGGFRRDAKGSLALGFRHGLYCVGCCWALMAILFVFGVMNVLWIALLSIFVLAEKVIPAGRIVARAAGVVLIALGAWLLILPAPS